MLVLWVQWVYLHQGPWWLDSQLEMRTALMAPENGWSRCEYWFAPVHRHGDG